MEPEWGDLGVRTQPTRTSWPGRALYQASPLTSRSRFQGAACSEHLLVPHHGQGVGCRFITTPCPFQVGPELWAARATAASSRSPCLPLGLEAAP